MKKKAPEGQWRRLDNTSKIFPVIANENMSQVFRISVTLKEEIQPEALQQALEDILPHIRNFRVRLRQGLFWYYFEENRRIPQVQRESSYPCRYIDPYGNRKFLFRITYYEKRINLEVFHALTDGLGAVSIGKQPGGNEERKEQKNGKRACGIWKGFPVVCGDYRAVLRGRECKQHISSFHVSRTGDEHRHGSCGNFRGHFDGIPHRNVLRQVYGSYEK